jgi:predicted transcriptional regulator
MPLTVRLDDALSQALDAYCARAGVSKSLVVQESLARYLARDTSQGADGAAPSARAARRAASANLKAFERAGLIGCIEAGGQASGTPVAADKAGVRAQAAARIQSRQPQG